LVNGNGADRKQVMDNISQEIFVRHFEQLGYVPEDELFDSSHTGDCGIVNEKLNDEIVHEEV
jgi:hypothetical protein